jgi:hypothetical protein
MSSINKFTQSANKIMSHLLDDNYITSFLLLFFVTYGSFLGSGGKPPEFIIKMFKNPVVRILLLTLLAYIANKNIQVSLGIAIVFYLTQQYIFKQESFNQIKSLEKFQNLYYQEKSKELEKH